MISPRRPETGCSRSAFPIPSLFRLTPIDTGKDANQRSLKSQLSGVAAATTRSGRKFELYAAATISGMTPVVIVHRDAWDWAVAWSTVVAAVLALVAILCALWAIRHSDKALIRERRMDCELGVLAQLAQACGNLWNASSSEVLALLDCYPVSCQAFGRRLRGELRGRRLPGTSEYWPGTGLSTS